MIPDGNAATIFIKFPFVSFGVTNFNLSAQSIIIRSPILIYRPLACKE